MNGTRINITARDFNDKLFFWNHQSGSWQENWGTQCDFPDSNSAERTKLAIIGHQRFLDVDEQMADIKIRTLT